MSINFNELIFDAAKDSITRFQWFLLTTTILSSLILLYLCVEQFGTLKSQLQQAIIQDVKIAAQHQSNPSKDKIESNQEPDIFQGRLAELDAEESVLKEKIKANTGNIDREINDFAKKKLLYVRTYNTLKDIKLRDRKLPLLDLELDANDYIPVMAIMLSIMMTAVWLSASSLESALRKLAQNDEGRQYIEVLKFRLTFLFPGDRGEILCINKVLWYAAMWLPFISLFAYSVIEIIDAIKYLPGVLPGYTSMVFRWGCLGISLSWLFIFAWLGLGAMSKIRTITYPAKN